MKQKNLVRLLALLAIIAFGIVFSTFHHQKEAAIQGDDGTTETRTMNQQNKAQSDFMIWETISRHLLSFNQ